MCSKWIGAGNKPAPMATVMFIQCLSGRLFLHPRQFRGVNIIEPADVVANHIALCFFRQMTKIALDNLDRVRPRRVGMRKVVGPHDVVLTPKRKVLAADMIVEKARENLLLDVAAWIA